MDAVQRLVGHVTDLMEQDNRGVQLACYTVAVTGLTVALRRERPFSRFRKPSDIPKHFIKERRELRGRVECINPDGSLLMVNHKPLVELPLVSAGQLPVKISGVNVSNFGLNWLQSIVAGNEVQFVPVTTTPKSVECEVMLTQVRDGKETVLNVGESLVKIGFASLALDQHNQRSYRIQLEQAQNFAMRKKLGIKYYTIPAKSILNTLSNKLITSGKQIARSPKLAAS